MSAKQPMFPIETLGDFSEYRERYVFKTNDGQGYLVVLLGVHPNGDSVALIGWFDRSGRVFNIFDGRAYLHVGEMRRPDLGKGIALARAIPSIDINDYIIRNRRLFSLYWQALKYSAGEGASNGTV